MKIFEKIKERLPFKKTKEKTTNKKVKKEDQKKSKLKTFINILAYIFGGIFLIVLLFSCVNSCRGSNEDNNNKSLNNIQYRANDSLLGTTWILEDYANWFSNITYNIDFTSDGNNYTGIRSIIDHGNYIYYLPNTTTYIWSAFDGYTNSAYKTITITGGVDVTNSGLITWLNGNATQYVEPVPEPSIDPSIDHSIDNSQESQSEYNYIDTIVFNNAFDWRILFSGGYQKNTGLFFLNRDYAIANPVVHFTGMEFLCNGVLYNTIDIGLIVCDNSRVVYTGYDNDGKQIEYVVNTSDLFSYNNDKSLCAISGVFYRYYDGPVDNLQNVTNQVKVYNGTEINYVAPSSEGGSTYVQSVNYNLHEWLANSYKKLELVSISTDGANSLYPNISTYELITTNENLVITEYGELGDVFTLLGGGFSALTSVFGIYILPNISIGVLIFLPLVVVLFITIIRLIKK